MKKSYILLAVLFAALLITSCQKPFIDEVSPVSVTTTARVKTYSENYTSSAGNYSITFNLNYDGSGRLLSMISASSPGDKFLYQYSGNTITLDLYNASILNIHEIFYLNPFSFIDSTFQYNDTKDTTTEKYFYNANKQLIKVLLYTYTTASGAVPFNTTNYTYDANGNVTQESDIQGVKTYTYSALLNTLSLGFEYLPRAKNLVQTTTIVSGGSTITYNHTYVFDNAGRLTSEKMAGSDGDILIKSYTY